MNSAVAYRAEMLGGQRFAWPERTPYLTASIDAAQIAVSAMVAQDAPGARVLREPDLLLTAQAAVIPDIAVFEGTAWTLPLLVIEYRAESTDRLFFGPKRLAYARARVPEVWFADVRARRVTVLRLGTTLDYPWPAASYSEDACITCTTIPMCFPARKLFGDVNAR